MNRRTKERFEHFRRQLARVIEVGASDDTLSRAYDFWITAIIVINLAVAVMSTFQPLQERAGALLDLSLIHI